MSGFQKAKTSQTQLIIQASGYNLPDKNKSTTILPLLKENQEKKLKGNHRSLSPQENRKINTSQEKILKSSLQIFPQNISNSKNFQNSSVKEEQHKMRLKKTLRSAQINRKIYSGQSNRIKSEYNKPHFERNMVLSASISSPNILPSQQQKMAVLSPNQYIIYTQYQNMQMSQSPSSQNQPYLHMRQSSQSMGNITQNSQKNFNFSTTSQYYNLEQDSINEQQQSYQQQQQQQSTISSASTIISNTPEQSKKFISKINNKQLWPISEESNPTADNINIKRFQSQEQQTTGNLSPIRTPMFPSLTSQNSQQNLTQTQNQGNNQQHLNQNRFQRKYNQNKPKTVSEGSIEQVNLLNKLREKEMHLQSASQQVERLIFDNKKLREEIKNQNKRIKQLEDLIGKEQFEQEKEEFKRLVTEYNNLSYNDLLIQLDSFCERLVKFTQSSYHDSQVDDIETLFKNFKRQLDTIRDQSSQNIQKSILTPSLRFYPSNLIKLDYQQRLGKGGFCSVYKVKLGNQEMAQKVFEYDLDVISSQISDTLENIFNEIKILFKVNTLHNPVFVGLNGISFDIRRNEQLGKDQFIFAIFMELIGEYDNNRFLTCDLKKFINSQINNPDYNKKFLELSLQISEGVETLFNNSIVHSDLKPQNILLDENQNIKIIDFGISKFRKQQDTHDTNLYGFTPRYCPIEHFDLERLTPTTDVWSFGCLLFEMVTGNEPWKGIKNQDLRRVLENKQSLWQHYQSHLSHQDTQHIHPEIIKLIEKCTAYKNRPHPSFVTEKINEILLQQN